jgi:hypothetical protein
MGFWRRPDVPDAPEAPAPPVPAMPSGPDVALELAGLRIQLAARDATIADLRAALEAARTTTKTTEMRRLERQAEQDRRNCVLMADYIAELEGRRFDAGRSEQGRVLFAGLRAMSPLVGPAPIRDKALNDPGCICAAPGCWTTPCKTRQTSERSG